MNEGGATLGSAFYQELLTVSDTHLSGSSTPAGRSWSSGEGRAGHEDRTPV